jgi:hypothetical protein
MPDTMPISLWAIAFRVRHFPTLELLLSGSPEISWTKVRDLLKACHVRFLRTPDDHTQLRFKNMPSGEIREPPEGMAATQSTIRETREFLIGIGVATPDAVWNFLKQSRRVRGRTE